MLFGKYEILADIGAGGMATVYRACLRAPGGAARPVALKVIHRKLSGEPLFVKLFLAETRVAMALNHRNIVQTFDAGQEGGQYYMAMELVNGCSLHELLKRCAGVGLPVDIALFVAVELCSALHYAHEFRPDLAGQPGAVVHCDVSPSNILLGREGVVKLADFGVARARDRMTQTSLDLVKGKLNYMAPEQARGRASPRSDIFAAGVVLHEMLVGRTLRRKTNLAEVLEGPKEIPAVQRPDVPPELEATIRSCLSASPAARPESALALRKFLASLLFQTQVRDGSGGDSHSRLGSFLSQVLDAQQETNRVARAIAEQALALSSVTGADQAASTRSHRPTAPTAVEPLRAHVPSKKMSPRVERVTAPTTVERGRREPLACSATAEEALPLVPARSLLWRYALLAGLLVALGLGVLYLLSRGGASPRGAVGDARPTRMLPPRGDGSAPSPDQARASDQTWPPTGRRARTSRLPTVPVTPRTGRLDLNSFPWAKVFVDGRYVGDTPVEGLKLPAGLHRVRLHNPERNLEELVQVQIRAGRTVSRIVELRPAAK